MSNKDFNKRLIEDTYKIIIDTSSLMQYKGFEMFINKNKKLLHDEDRKIFISKEVWLELIRAYNSSDEEKQTCAEKAMNVISKNREVIEVEVTEVLHYEMQNCFADPVLLCNLIIYRNEGNVLFITNDKMLSGDAYEINNQKSSRGYRIDTYYIDVSGELLPGYTYKQTHNDITKEIVKEKEVIRYIEVPIKTDSRRQNNLKGYIMCVAVGVMVGKYGIQSVKYVTKVLKYMNILC